MWEGGGGRCVLSTCVAASVCQRRAAAVRIAAAVPPPELPLPSICPPRRPDPPHHHRHHHPHSIHPHPANPHPILTVVLVGVQRRVLDLVRLARLHDADGHEAVVNEPRRDVRHGEQAVLLGDLFVALFGVRGGERVEGFEGNCALARRRRCCCCACARRRLCASAPHAGVLRCMQQLHRGLRLHCMHTRARKTHVHDGGRVSKGSSTDLRETPFAAASVKFAVAKCTEQMDTITSSLICMRLGDGQGHVLRWDCELRRHQTQCRPAAFAHTRRASAQLRGSQQRQAGEPRLCTLHRLFWPRVSLCQGRAVKRSAKTAPRRRPLPRGPPSCAPAPASPA